MRHSNPSPSSSTIPQALQVAHDRIRALGPQSHELYFVKKSSTKIDCKDQKVDSLTRAEDVGLSIRILRDGKMGFSYTTSVDRESIERSVQAAWEIASLMPADPYNELLEYAGRSYPEYPERIDQSGLNAPINQKIEMAMRLEHICRSADARIKNVRSAALSELLYEVQMLDRAGNHLSHRSSMFSGSVTCKAEQNGEAQMGGDFGFDNELSQLKIDAIGLEAARTATELLGATPPQTMKCPAVFKNSVVADLLEFLSGSFSAEEIDKGRSLLGGKQGQKIFAPQIDLIDDALYPGGYGSGPFDSEGAPAGRINLVSKGVFSSILSNSYYSKKLGIPLTGSATRSIKAPPSIGVSNMYLKPGSRSLAELISGTHNGILITDLMGVHTANEITGDFSLGASGILIENGRTTRAVRGFAVAGNVLGLFAQVTDIGSDLRFFGSVGAPSLRVSEISIGGKD